MYLIAGEDDGGIWWDEPKTANTLAEARRIAKSCALPEGYNWVLYRAYQEEVIEPLHRLTK